MPKSARRERIIIDIEKRGDDDETLTLSTTSGLGVDKVISTLERAKIKFITDNTTSSKEEKDATGDH